jgi:uncharacterized membrane protein YeaQ/YmgE (transglycosylase-associated protein family)
MILVQFIAIGMAAGWVVGRAMRGRGFGLVGNLVVGASGSLVGGYVFGFAGQPAESLFGRWIAAVVGAVLFLLILSFLRPGRGKATKKESAE